MAQITGSTAKPPVHTTKYITLGAVVIIVVVAFILGWIGGSRHNKSGSASQNAANSNMVTYKNQENGFQLQYPMDWGAPGFVKTNNNGTTFYALSFAKNSSGNLSYTITLTMNKSGAHSVTSDTVKNVLKLKKSEVAASDTSSYATIAGIADKKVSSLSETQIVDLKKAGVTAATMTYTISGGSATCPQNKFAQDANSSCITQADYNTVNQVLKSLKSI
jgi:hypothetical protein